MTKSCERAFHILLWIVPLCSLFPVPVLGQFAQQGTKLVGSNASALVYQGSSVAISSDGNTVIVGGPSDGGNAGAAWVSTRSSGVWTQQGSKLVGSGAIADVLGYVQQGSSVALSGDGNTAIVGGPCDNFDTGAAWVFTRSGGVWTQQGPKLVGSGVRDAYQGRSVALSEDGNTAIVGAPGLSGSAGNGGAFVFTRAGGMWTQQGSQFVSSFGAADAQGTSVGLSGDGNTAIVGTFADTKEMSGAFVFTRTGGVWSQQGQEPFGQGSGQGQSVAISGDGNTALIGGSGPALVFTLSGGVWTQQGSLPLSGQSVALSGDGNTAIAGNPQYNDAVGAAWVFTRSGGAWTQRGPTLIGNGIVGDAMQGSSVALSGDGNTALVGAANDNDGVGAALVFAQPATGVTASPTSLSFSYTQPELPPSPASVQVSGNSAGLSFVTAVTTQDGGSWLSVTPTSGVTPSALSISTSIAALGAGTYNGTVTVTGTDGATGSTTINVTLTVSLPPIRITAVTNAASFQSGHVAPGEIVSIFGSGLGPATPAFLTLDQDGNVSTSLGGVQVLLLFSGIPAPLTYVSSSQINAVMPYEMVDLLTPYVEVEYQGQSSNIFSLTAASASPALFTSNGSGAGPGAILNQDNSYNGPANPAPKGSVVVIFMTGEGQTSPPGVTGKVTTVSSTLPLTPQPLLPVTVSIGGQPASVLFYGEAPNLVSGVMQINVQVPTNVASGDLPIQVSVGASTSQLGVTVSVQ